MAQSDFNLIYGGDKTGLGVRTRISAALEALRTMSSGTTAPTSVSTGQIWLETDNPSATEWTMWFWDGAGWISLGTIDTTNIFFKPTGAANFNLPSSIAVSSTSPALTITQTGTGHAIQVNDVASDTTPFVVDQSGNVGIGNSAPAAPIDLTGGSLGVNLGDFNSLTKITGNSGNVDGVFLNHVRDAAGTTYLSAGFRYQMKIDATWMAWMQFNGNGNK